VGLLYKTEVENAQIFIWENEVKTDTLYNRYKKRFDDDSIFQEIQNEKRKIIYINSRSLLFSLFPNENLSKNEFGAFQPSNSGKHLSLSHTNDYTALGISNKPLGLDIEKSRPEISKVWKRFSHPKEKELFTLPFEKLLLWTCKEALFKKQQHSVDFAKDICIKSYTGKKAGNITGTIKGEAMQCQFLTLRDHVISVAL
jgi:4'-phosphopantetheinyl transferase